jgi:predicted ATPase
MIKRIVIENFKSLKKVDLKLGQLNLFIGTNASGKSNFFDALRVLQGIGYGFTLHEILDGKPKGASSEVWDGIRGGSQRATSSTSTPDELIRIQVSGQLQKEWSGKSWRYTIAFSAPEGRLREEQFWIDDEIVYDSSPLVNSAVDPVFEIRYYGGKKGRQPHLKFEKNRPVLCQFAQGANGKWTKSHAEAAEQLVQLLADVQRIDPSPTLLRSYSHAHEIRRMGEHGENFAALVKSICAQPSVKEAYVSWLRELRPREVEDVGTLPGAVGEPLFMLKEGGREYPAQVLSDGTLRFAAITAAFFQPEMPRLLTIEEIENGIHASRLRLLVELLRSRSSKGLTQLLATSHSPIVLAWLKPEEYATTFFCKRDEETGESRICPLTEIPHFNEVVKRQPISDLFAEGWLEGAL